MAKSLGANYQRLWTASGFSNLADGVFQVSLPLLALRLTRSPAAVAGVALAARLPWLLFALHAGALADRLDRKRTMVNVDIARVVLIGGLGMVVALEHEQLWLLYVIAFLLGIGETLFDTAAQSVMPVIVEPDELSRANGRLYAVEMIMNQFVGPPLGGILAGVAIAAAFLGSAGAYALAAVALVAMVGHFRPERSGPPTRLRTDIAEGVRYLTRHRLLRTLAFMVGVMNLSSTAAFAVFPLFAVDPGPMGLSEAGFGILLTTMAVGSLAGTWIAPRLERRWGRARTLLVTVIGSAAFTAAPLLTEPVLVALGFVVAGMTIIAWNIITVSLRQRIVPDALMGRVNATYRLLAWGTMPIGAALGGVIAEVFGVQSVFVIATFATLSLLLCMTIVTDSAIEAAEREGGRIRPPEPEPVPEPDGEPEPLDEATHAGDAVIGP
jgi:MFS family permease